MRTVKLHYDGWLHLPEELVREFGRAGVLSIERRDGGLFITLPRPAAPVAEPEPDPVPAVTQPGPTEAAAPVKRGRGRPRKVVEPDQGTAPAGPAAASGRARLPKALQPQGAARGRRAATDGNATYANGQSGSGAG